MTTRTTFLGCHTGNTPATMRAMSTTPIMDNIHEALNHAVHAVMDTDPGWIRVPEIHVSKITWTILEREFMTNKNMVSAKPPMMPLDDDILGYLGGYPIKRLKYGQGWTIIYRETEITDRKRMI